MTTSPTASDTDTPRPGGPPAWFAIIAIGLLGVGVLLLGAQVLGLRIVNPGPAPTLAPTGDAAARTAAQVTAALQAASFQVRQPQTPYRPGESPALQDVPRTVLQAVLPADPEGGDIVIYELPTSGDADRVGRDFAAYLASGTGAIQYPRDSQFVIRRIGETLVFFTWSPQADPDPRTPEVATALQTIGVPITP
jgi:hypothetical protein